MTICLIVVFHLMTRTFLLDLSTTNVDVHVLYTDLMAATLLIFQRIDWVKSLYTPADLNECHTN